MLEPLVAAFVLAFISEIADKTQLVILGLALKFRSPFKVFAGALLAHAFMDGAAIILGTFFGFSLSSSLIRKVIGVVFILLGGWGLAKLYFRRQDERGSVQKERNALGATALASSFLTVMLSEFGDKTQIASGLLAAKYLMPLSIFIGFVLALSIAIGLNVFVGSRIAKRLPRKTIKMVAASLFILFGVFSLVY